MRSRILYYPGPASKKDLLIAVKDFNIEIAEAGTVHLLLIPTAVSLSKEDLGWIEGRGLSLDYLYRLATDDGIDLGQVELPDYRPAPGCFFRRSADGWEVGFDTTKPRAVLDKSGMEAIWFLLRNPGEEFTAVAINDQLNAFLSGPAPMRLSGSKAKSIADLPPEVKKEVGELTAEIARAKEDNDERGYRDANEDYKRILKDHGIKDSFGGMAARENDDYAKEAGSLTRAIKRCIESLEQTTELSELAAHLETHLEWGKSFRYAPPEIPRWRTE